MSVVGGHHAVAGRVDAGDGGQGAALPHVCIRTGLAPHLPPKLDQRLIGRGGIAPPNQKPGLGHVSCEAFKKKIQKLCALFCNVFENKSVSEE